MALARCLAHCPLIRFGVKLAQLGHADNLKHLFPRLSYRGGDSKH